MPMYDCEKCGGKESLRNTGYMFPDMMRLTYVFKCQLCENEINIDGKQVYEDIKDGRIAIYTQ